jgi:hypothetical protein
MAPWQRSHRWVETPSAVAGCDTAGDLGILTAKELIAAVVTANGSRQVVAAAASALWRLVLASPPSTEVSDLEGLRGKVKLVEAELVVRGDISRLAGLEFTHAAAARAWLCQRIEDEQGSGLAEILVQIRDGSSALAKARNSAVHGPLRAGKRRGLSAARGAEPPGESVVDVGSEGGGSSSGGFSAAGNSRGGSCRDAEVCSSSDTGDGSCHGSGFRRGPGVVAAAVAALNAKVLEYKEWQEHHEQAKVLAGQAPKEAGQQQATAEVQAEKEEFHYAESAAVVAAKAKVLENKELQEQQEQASSVAELAGQAPKEAGQQQATAEVQAEKEEFHYAESAAVEAAKAKVLENKELQEQQEQASSVAEQVHKEAGPQATAELQAEKDEFYCVGLAAVAAAKAKALEDMELQERQEQANVLAVQVPEVAAQLAAAKVQAEKVEFCFAKTGKNKARGRTAVSLARLVLGRPRGPGSLSRTVGRWAGCLAVLVVGMVAACGGTVGMVMRGEPSDFGGCSRHLGCEVPLPPLGYYDDEVDDGEGDYEVCEFVDHEGRCVEHDYNDEGFEVDEGFGDIDDHEGECIVVEKGSD